MSNALAPHAGKLLTPSTYAEARDFATVLAGSDMVPSSYKGKPGNIMIAMAWGSEVGLGPLQAIQSIAVINGKPSLWGDAALALVRSHPACGGIREGVEGEGDARVGFCEVTRKGEQPQRRTFSVADAKKAGLWGKSGPWQNYPDRMLQMRARGFAIRDVFPDALRGVITAEEAQDIPTEPMPPPRGPVIDAAADFVRPSADPIPWDVVTPKGTMRAKDGAQWLAWCRKAISMCGDMDALDAWRMAMEPHFISLSEFDDDTVRAVDGAAGARRAELASAEAAA